MEDQIEAIKQQIDKDHATMHNIAYNLHAIIVHDGNAYSGHYYSFIYDRFRSKWFMFSDIQVTEVSEEEVFKKSNGGCQENTAYYVVYLDKQLSEEVSKADLYSYSLEKNLVPDPSHIYQRVIPGAVNMLVAKSNEQQMQALEDWKV